MLCRWKRAWLIKCYEVTFLAVGDDSCILHSHHTITSITHSWHGRPEHKCPYNCSECFEHTASHPYGGMPMSGRAAPSPCWEPSVTAEPWSRTIHPQGWAACAELLPKHNSDSSMWNLTQMPEQSTRDGRACWKLHTKEGFSFKTELIECCILNGDHIKAVIQIISF